MTRLRNFISRTYFSVDPRSLGLFRIVFGLVLLFDLHNHWQVIDFWYTDEGLLPGSALLAHPPTPRLFSLFFLTTSHLGVSIGMVICAVVYLAYTLGWRTRIAAPLVFVCVVSLNGRVALLNNGGDTVLNLLAMWTLFLPLGRRFSLDSLIRSLRDRQEHSAEQLDQRDALAPDNAQVVSLAVFALLLQFSCIYLFGAIQKNGYTWLEGTAVHYALHQDRIVTGFGVLAREYGSQWMFTVASWGTRVAEGVAPLLILSPVLTRHARLVAIVVLLAMHAVFGMSLMIGSFSYAMMSFFPLLLASEHWDGAIHWGARRTHRRTVFFDSDCGICFLTVRILARLDAFHRLRFVSNKQTDLLPDVISAADIETTVVVTNEATGEVWTRSSAAADVLRALPLGFAIATVMRWPGIRFGCDALYDAVSRNRTAISTRLGLAACGIPAPAGTPDATGPKPRVRSRGVVHPMKIAAEAAVAVMLVASFGQLVQHNFAVPRALRYRQPEWLQLLVDYPRLHQGWRMFTPEGPPQEFMLGVEAVTASGRRVDPFNEVASRYSAPSFERIPVRLGFDQFFGTYSELSARGDLGPYQSALVRWILRYPERTGNPADRIVRFELIKISDISPAPGRLDPTNVRRRVLLRYPKEAEG